MFLTNIAAVTPITFFLLKIQPRGSTLLSYHRFYPCHVNWWRQLAINCRPLAFGRRGSYQSSRAASVIQSVPRRPQSGTSHGILYSDCCYDCTCCFMWHSPKRSASSTRQSCYCCCCCGVTCKAIGKCRCWQGNSSPQPRPSPTAALSPQQQ